MSKILLGDNENSKIIMRGLVDKINSMFESKDSMVIEVEENQEIIKVYDDTKPCQFPTEVIKGHYKISLTIGPSDKGVEARLNHLRAREKARNS